MGKQKMRDVVRQRAKKKKFKHRIFQQIATYKVDIVGIHAAVNQESNELFHDNLSKMQQNYAYTP